MKKCLALLTFVALLTKAGLCNAEVWVVTFKAGQPFEKALDHRLARLTPYSEGIFRRVYRFNGDKKQMESFLNIHTSIIERVEESVPVDLYSSDPLFHEQWYLKNTGQVVREEITNVKSEVIPPTVGVDVGLPVNETGLRASFKRTVAVAILDTGVDYEHPELVDSILLNRTECDNGKIPLGQAKEDTDNNGYPGDCMGINLAVKDPLLKNRPTDSHGHGTHLAGEIAAKSGNGIGIRGISDQIKILPVKLHVGNERRLAISDRMAEGILYAVKRKVDVINISMGYPLAADLTYVREAVKEAVKNGVQIVAAAGNNAHSVPVYPCAYDGVICVGALRNDGKVASFSNVGAHVDLYAPGQSILSTVPTATQTYYAVRGYDVKSGTSQAAPLLSGMIAMAKAIHPGVKGFDIYRALLGARRADRSIRLDELLSQLSGASRAKSQPVAIVFKDQGVSVVDQLGNFSVRLNLINTSDAEVSIAWPLKFGDSKLSVRTANLTAALGPRESKDVEVRGRVLDRAANYRAILSVKTGDGTEQISFALATDDLFGATADQLSVEDSKGFKFIESVNTEKGRTTGRFLMGLMREKPSDPIQFRFWRRAGLKYVKAFDRTFSRLDGFVSAVQIDANGDGTDDLLILGQWKDGETPRLILHYIDQSGRPLYPGLKDGLALNDPPVFNYLTFADWRHTLWRSVRSSELGTIKLPTVIDTRFTPAVDRSLAEQRRVRRDPTYSPAGRHLYFLELWREGATLSLRTRIVDTEDFLDSVRSVVGLQYYESITPRFKLSDDGYLFSAGTGSSAKPLLVFWDQGHFSFRVLPWAQAWNGYTAVQFRGEGQQKETTGLIGLLSQSRVHVVIPGRTDFVLDLPDPSEMIQNLMLPLVTKDGFQLMFEAAQKVFGFSVTEKGELKDAVSEPVTRTTFFGQVFTQVSWPVADRKNRNYVYIDDTQINARMIRLERLTGAGDAARGGLGFVAPVATSFSLPANCRTLNPARWAPDGGDRLTALCFGDGDLIVRSLAIPTAPD
jgi:subtilisin family serine protease